jgi:hypothetical protein
VSRSIGRERERTRLQATALPSHPSHLQEAGRADSSAPTGDVTARAPRSRDEVIAALVRSAPPLSPRKNDRLRALLAPFAETPASLAEGADAA